MDTDFKQTVPNKWESANPISKFLFLWVFPLFRKGFYKELTIHDIYDAPPSHTSLKCVDKLQRAWDKEVETSKTKGKQPRFWKSLVSVHHWGFLIYLAIVSVDELFIRVMQPIYIRKLVKSFNDENVDRGDQAFYAGVVCLSSLAHNLLIHQCVFIMFRTGLLCRTATSSMLFRKALRIRVEERGSATGTLQNLLSNDMSRFDYQLIFLPYIIIAPLQLIILIYILYAEMGISALFGAGFIVLVLPTQVLNGKLAAKFRQSVAKLTDERSQGMNEIVMAIRVIKMYAWEMPFSKIIHRIRKNEVRELGKRAYLRGFFLSLYTVFTRLAAFLVILVYVLGGNQLTADKAFFTVGIYLTIVESMIFYFSTAISGIGECLVSTQRIEQFLQRPEQPDNLENELKEEKVKESHNNIYSQTSIVPSVNLINASASWVSSEKTTLNNLNLSLSGDKLVIIVGPVGSGKTSLLHLLISEIPLIQGSFKISGEISYAPQESWIFPANLRNNILFGQPYDAFRYDQVVTVCALKDDFNQLPHGDMTVIGERGITLSGGQKARVNLARSLYRDSSILLWDDPLSAVDQKTSRRLFDGLKGIKGKLRILVTHQIQYLSAADYIVVLNHGNIHSQGTYDDLIKSGVDFMSIISSSDENDPNSNSRKLSIVEKMEEENDPLKDYEKPEENIEKMQEGKITLSTYWGYISSANSYPRLLFTIFLFLCGQFLLTSCEYWLSYWTDSEDFHNNQEKLEGNNNETSSTISSFDNIEIFDRENYLGETTYLTVYSALVFTLFVFTISKAVGFFGYCLKISINIHDRMFKAIVRAPTKFFDENPSGRIINRFTKDIGSLDELLPGASYDTVEYTLQMLGVVIIILISNYFLIIPTIIIIVIFWLLRVVFVRTSRDIKRLESIWKSPVFIHVAASLQGLTTIRSLRAQDILINQFDEKQDIHTSTWFAFISTTRCFAVWAETTGIIFLTVITFSFLLFAEQSSAGLVGLVITSTLSLTVNIQWAIRQSAEMETQLLSVERCLEYIKLKPEAPLECPDKKPPKDWPSEGSIQFQNVSLSYEEKDVLKNLSFEIRPKEKIGIVGRTGAGKSSIISALFRLTEPRGNILVDGVNIAEIGLHDLRSSISIIPQDPVLFSGTIRYNLDPFNQFDDSQLWEVLEQVQLKDVVSTLDFKVSDGGENFSVGQRQLVCLARAVLRKNKILLCDEATANVDPKTDEFIQKTIRQTFDSTTTITIAHRLQSVMDCDRILVLEAGEIMEYGHPFLLLQNPKGLLTTLTNHAGKTSSEMLRQMAKNHFEKYGHVQST